MDSLRVGSDSLHLEGKWALAAAVGAGAIYWMFGPRRSSGHAVDGEHAKPEARKGRVRSITETINERERRSGGVPPLVDQMQGRMRVNQAQRA